MLTCEPLRGTDWAPAVPVVSPWAPMVPVVSPKLSRRISVLCNIQLVNIALQLEKHVTFQAVLEFSGPCLCNEKIQLCTMLLFSGSPTLLSFICQK